MSKTLQEWRKALGMLVHLQQGAQSTSSPGLPGSWLYIDILEFSGGASRGLNSNHMNKYIKIKKSCKSDKVNK